MNTQGFRSAVFVHVATGLLTIAAAGAWANEPNLAEGQSSSQLSGQPSGLSFGRLSGQSSGHELLAQAVPTTETGCRQANTTTGVYVQPSFDSESRGILNRGQTVRLELVGTGTGWARITAPVMGWVEAKYLSPASACTGLPPSQAVQSTPAGTGVTAAGSVSSASPGTPMISGSTIVTAVCEVLPTEGLVVRSEPTIAANNALHTIPKGVHQFQFTNDYVRSHSGNVERYWTYITAPYPGWISLGVVGGRFNLGGHACG